MSRATGAAIGDAAVVPRASRAQPPANALLAGLAALVAALVLVSLVLGPYHLGWGDVFAALTGSVDGAGATPLARLHHTVIWQIRLPRLLLVVLVGLALPVTGATYQGVFRNPLVDPFILGVASGASFGAGLALLLPGFPASLQVGAFAGGLLAVAIAYGVAQHDGRESVASLLLAGIVTNALFQAALSTVKYVSDDQALRAIVFWAMGGFYNASWTDVAIAAPAVLAGVLVLWGAAWRLNVLSVGDDEARTLGVDPGRVRSLLVVVATLVTAICVSLSGVVAWVGLMVPHAVRRFVGADHRVLIPASALAGAAFLLICDDVARLATHAELPIGIVTSLMGAPYLLVLARGRGGWWGGRS